MAQQQTKTTRQHKLKDALALLEAGVTDFISLDGWQTYLKKQAQFHHYSARNLFLILIQNPHATRCAGYKTWQSLGRQVRKGEKGLSILAPMVYKTDNGSDPNDKGKDYVVRGFKAIKVFDISQTDGEDLDAGLPPIEAVGGDQTLYARLKHFSRQRGVPVVENECGGANGCCYYNNDGSPKHIEIAPNRPLANRIKTLLHEIGHALMHEWSAYRQHTEVSRAEMEAESFAFLMADYFGIDCKGFSFRYLAAWAPDDNPGAIIQEIGGVVQKTAHEAIEQIEQLADTELEKVAA